MQTAPGRGKVRSVLLNADPQDTGSPTKRLRLTLGYAANLDKVRGRMYEVGELQTMRGLLQLLNGCVHMYGPIHTHLSISPRFFFSPS